MSTNEPAVAAPAVAAAAATAAPPLPKAWKDCQSIYPDSAEIVVALQDEGVEKVKKNRKTGLETPFTKFPLVEKLAQKIYTNIYNTYNKPDGLEKNASRGKAPLSEYILNQRKSRAATETNIFFHPYAKDGMVYQLKDDPVTCGVDLAIDAFQESTKQNLSQKNVCRTGNDGLRLACILLDPKYRGTVAGIMTNKKSQQKSDQTVDPTTAFFDEIIDDCYLNMAYEAAKPPSQHYDRMAEDVKSLFDPNAVSIFKHHRDGAWLRETWETYISRKYKKALDKWNKDTGGGDGDPISFVDYCDNSDRWLVWVFLLDMETNFVMASSTTGRMPAHLQLEGGFDDPVSSLDNSNNTEKALEAELAAARSDRMKLSASLDKAVSYLESKESSTPKRQKCLKKVAEFSRMMNEDQVLATMTPRTMKMYLDTLNDERNNILKEVATTVTDNPNNNDSNNNGEEE